ncbi:MAG TPA: MFS transporter [Thermodesulfobacteriota bacterium]|nr:MFS transporter [Thermodesulfobacteriota bacterium]
MMTQTMRKILTREFVLGVFSQFAFISVFYILIPTLPVYLLRSGSREAEIGVLIGVFFVSALALRPFVGRALLRIPEKDFMIAGAVIFVLSSFAYLVAPPFWPFLFLRIIQGIGLALFHTASFTLIANISPEAHLGQSLGYFFLAPNVSLALLPSLGMFLINRFSFNILFLTCLGLSLCALLITVQLQRRPVAPVEDSPSKKATLLNRKAIPPSVVSLLNFIIWGALTTFFPLYALNHGVTNSGLFFTVVAVMFFLGRAFGGKILDLYNRNRVIPLLLTMSVASMVILAFSKNLTMFVLVGVIWGIGNALLTPAILAYILDRTGSPKGPAIGMYMLLSDLGLGLGPLMMGIVIRLSSYPTMFLSLALTGVINLFYFYFFVRKR